MKSARSYYVLLAVLVLLYIVFEIAKPKPIDWRDSYANKDKIPYGTYALYDFMSDLFPASEIKTMRKPVYNVVSDLYAYDDSIGYNYNYVFINNSFDIDSLDFNMICSFVEAGNNVFIATLYNNSDTLCKKLGIEFEREETIVSDSVVANFTDKKLNAPKGYIFRGWDSKNYFSLNPEAKVEVLGKNMKGNPDFIRAKYGDGYFYFNTHPKAFTNYYVLNDSTMDYAFTCLSYLPVRTVLWDEYQKQGREGDQSVYRVLFNNPALKWAYYITIFSLLIFILFEGKRRQRIIPVIEPLKNTTLEFTRTLGNLYLAHRNHKNIAQKKIVFFFGFIREKLFIATNEINIELIENISARSGLSKEKVDDIFKMINYVNYQEQISQEELLKLNHMLEEFYKNVNT